MAKEYTPIKLIKNTVFPSYQLYAQIDDVKIKTDEVLKICILETLFWIRQKFENLEIPDEIKSPSPSQYEEFNLNDLKTFRIERGYIVDVVYIPEQKSWSFQLVEPDLAASVHPPVPGRVFTTDISFRIVNQSVICAFRTLVSEPENCNEEVLSLRNGVIKRLVRNPLIKLSHFSLPVIEKSIVLNSETKIKMFNQSISNQKRCLPLVVLSEYQEDKKKVEKKENVTISEIAPSKKSLSINTYTLNSHTSNINAGFDIISNIDNKKSKELLKVTDTSKKKSSVKTVSSNINKAEDDNPKSYYLYDANDIAKILNGSAIVYSLPISKFEEFKSITKTAFLPGDIILIEPKQYGNVSVFKAFENADESLKAFMKSYHVKKAVDLSDFYFVHEARILQQESMLSRCDTLEERAKITSVLTKELETMRSSVKELNDYKAKSIQAEDKLKTANATIDDLKQKLLHHKDLLKEEKDNKTRREFELQMQVDYFHSLDDRPKTPQGIMSWVEKNFSNSIILHERAKDLLENLNSQDVNMKKLCDAIEYLATEYYSFYYNALTEEIADKYSSLKYNQKFNVCPSGGSGDMKKLSRHYKIKYDKNDGKGRKEYPLDMHLKSGNHNDNLIRIYFHIDEVNKKIVIGSLPKHLRTASQTT